MRSTYSWQQWVCGGGGLRCGEKGGWKRTACCDFASRNCVMNILNRMTFQMCGNGTRLSYFLENGISVLWQVIIGVNSPIFVHNITSI